MDSILSLPGSTIITSALTFLAGLVTSTIFFVWIIRRRTKRFEAKLAFRGLSNIDHEDLYHFIENAEKPGGLKRLTGFLHSAMSYEQGRLVEPEQPKAIECGLPPLNEIMSRMRSTRVAYDPEKDQFLNDLDEIIASEEEDAKVIERLANGRTLDDFVRKAKEEPKKAIFYRLCRNRDGVGSFVAVDMRELGRGDLFKTSNDPQNRIWRALSDPYHQAHRGGVMTVDAEPDDSVESFIEWCRRVMEPAGLHKDTEEHLRNLFGNKGKYLSHQRRQSGRTTAACLYAAYFGKLVSDIGNEDDPDVMNIRKMKHSTAETFQVTAEINKHYFPGGKIPLPISPTIDRYKGTTHEV